MPGRERTALDGTGDRALYPVDVETDTKLRVAGVTWNALRADEAQALMERGVFIKTGG